MVLLLDMVGAVEDVLVDAGQSRTGNGRRANLVHGEAASSREQRTLQRGEAVNLGSDETDEAAKYARRETMRTRKRDIASP